MDFQVTKEKIQEVVQRIADQFHPEKIILFGSQAWGGAGLESDVDLLVVKESRKPRVERERELNELLFPRSVPLDLLVYTPKELQEKIEEDRNLFLEDIIENGVVLYENNKVRL